MKKSAVNIYSLNSTQLNSTLENIYRVQFRIQCWNSAKKLATNPNNSINITANCIHLSTCLFYSHSILHSVLLLFFSLFIVKISILKWWCYFGKKCKIQKNYIFDEFLSSSSLESSTSVVFVLHKNIGLNIKYSKSKDINFQFFEWLVIFVVPIYIFFTLTHSSRHWNFVAWNQREWKIEKKYIFLLFSIFWINLLLEMNSKWK